MKRVVIYVLIATIVITGIGSYFWLSNRQAQLNEQVLKLELKLRVGAEKYTRCYYSINNGSYLVRNVNLSHLRYDSTDSEKAQLNKIQSDFMDSIREKCQGVVTSYENQYREYETKAEEAASSAWVGFLVGGTQAIDSQLSDLSMIRFQTGDALTFFIFTKEDVEKYFHQRFNPI